MIAYYAADLLWASKIKATAEAIGIAARPVRSVEMLEARLADSPVRGLVVDLDGPEIAMALLSRIRQSPQQAENAAKGSVFAGAGRVRVAAFGPHVETELLRRASELGADVVLTRGAMDKNMERVLRELDAD